MQGRKSLKDLSRLLRRKPTANESIIIEKGLSPWSLVSSCDLCASVVKYQIKHNISLEEPLIQHGRWMLHEQCAASNGHLSTIDADRLDYRPLTSLPPAIQITIMKYVLWETAGEAVRESHDLACMG